ncbi:MAG: sugar phosphate isomerase/epimerase [Gemmatimonadota bacterium]
MTSRREFTKALAALAAYPPLARWSPRRRTPLGVQLYTVRDSMQRDVEGTLARVRSIGYREVEFAGYFGRTPAQIKAALGSNGLDAPSVHVGLDALTTRFEDTLEAAVQIGHRWLTLAWIDSKDRSADGYDRIADQLNASGALAARSGIRIAYHTHDYVFTPWRDGTVPLHRFMTRLDPHLIDIELDCYWAVVGGSDPRLWFDRFPGRFPMVHVKDAGPAPGFVMADVGAGTMDWRHIFALRHRAGIKHYFIEHDEPVEPWSSITAGYRYLSSLNL